ncbi:MAG: Eco57I restriction-modification methylase domain-containing protein [Candidatus Komeilibacteria bacterium]|nr:Eco57I restriction-modification methylase domain-containing protein [Candidatus Komeilibacteria bacterium]
MNAIIKKENGIVFTPEWVVNFMVDELLNNQEIKGDETILDAGCGEGVFATIAAQKFSKLTGKKIKNVIEENIYFTDISEEYVEKTKQNLQKLSNSKITKFNAITDDFCFHDFNKKFSFIIGNPPYVRIQNLNGRKEKLQKSYISASSGSVDLYFCFFEQALKLLNNNGKIAFITPNSHFYSAAGKNLRDLLLPHLIKIINFDHFQVFKDVTAYTAISFLQKEETDNFLYAGNFKNDFNNIKYKKISALNMRPHRWEFFDEKYLDNIVALNKKYSTLNEIAEIHYGIATLKDNIYIFSPKKKDKEFYYFNNFKIEKDLCVPIIKASTYKGEAQNLFLIFPYKYEKIIPKNIFQKNYPKAYEYFLYHQDTLAMRDKGGGKNYEEFYAFGRNQGLKTSFGKKIITSTMNLKPHFYVVEDEEMSFYAGYCIKPKNNTDIYELCEVLNSNLMEKYINSVSKSYRGGYKSYAKSFLKDFVHPQFYKSQPVLF